METLEQVVIVEGLITASDWDEWGAPTRVKICSAGEIDYLVDNTNNGEALLSRLREHVRVEGSVRESGECRLIKIRSILTKNA